VSKMSNLHALTADERADTAEVELAYVMDLNRELVAACQALLDAGIGRNYAVMLAAEAKARAAIRRAQEHAEMQVPPIRSGS
jgi:hypothetical protein